MRLREWGECMGMAVTPSAALQCLELSCACDGGGGFPFANSSLGKILGGTKREDSGHVGDRIQSRWL